VPGAASEAARRCGVSSFGIGGTNVHMILEEPPRAAGKPAASAAAAAAAASAAAAAAPTRRAVHMLCVSAKSGAAARRAAEALAAALEGEGAPPLEHVAAQLLGGRELFSKRVAVSAATRAEAVAALRAAAAAPAPAPAPASPSPSKSSSMVDLESAGGGGGGARRRGKTPPVVLLFPGQGSQCPRMGEGIYRSEPAYRRHVDRMCATLRPLLGFDLRERLFPAAGAEDADGFRAAFDAPTVTQPAIFVTELALGRTLVEEYGLAPAALAGHSIGEFVAATLAGVLPEEDALALIATRARLSEEAQPGGMLAVALSAARAAEVAAMPSHRGKVWLAVRNSGGRTVLAGDDDALLAVQAPLDSGVSLLNYEIAHHQRTTTGAARLGGRPLAPAAAASRLPHAPDGVGR